MSLKSILRQNSTVKNSTCDSVIGFNPISLEDRELYNFYLFTSGERGCENSFANAYMWAEQRIAIIKDSLVRLARFGECEFYAYPLGDGNKSEVIKAMEEDACARGIVFTIGGITPELKEELEREFPGRYKYIERRNSFDYVYEIDALATLGGKKYHGKRNHCSRFEKEHPDYRTEEITDSNIHLCIEMVKGWYREKEMNNPSIDYRGEKRAIELAFNNYNELGLEGILLLCDGKVVAFTMGNKMSCDTFDVNFEKAENGINGAYAVINREFALFIKNKHPEIIYLNREEDMGIEGLRKAKESYYPHHMVMKYRAVLREDSDEI
ncbi:MAG: DUF2156 domain-containing protein [Clostridia bacterium]|nr:DUF2156 domain-containing protein [Clostridia bacterium]